MTCRVLSYFPGVTCSIFVWATSVATAGEDTQGCKGLTHTVFMLLSKIGTSISTVVCLTLLYHFFKEDASVEVAAHWKDRVIIPKCTHLEILIRMKADSL